MITYDKDQENLCEPTCRYYEKLPYSGGLCAHPDNHDEPGYACTGKQFVGLWAGCELHEVRE